MHDIELAEFLLLLLNLALALHLKFLNIRQHFLLVLWSDQVPLIHAFTVAWHLYLFVLLLRPLRDQERFFPLDDLWLRFSLIDMCLHESALLLDMLPLYVQLHIIGPELTLWFPTDIFQCLGDIFVKLVRFTNLLFVHARRHQLNRWQRGSRLESVEILLHIQLTGRSKLITDHVDLADLGKR